METVAELFPEGRILYYEGSDPEAFADQIRDELGLDPRISDGRAEGYDNGLYGAEWTAESGYSFYCPPQHLQAIYGSGRFPIGT